MQQRTGRIIAAICVVGAVAVIAPTASASLVTSTPASGALACTLTSEKELVAQPTTAAHVVASSDSLPGTLTAEFASGSKITVDSVSRDMGASGTSFRVVANTSQAVAGKWELKVSNGTTSCAGDVTVSAP